MPRNRTAAWWSILELIVVLLVVQLSAGCNSAGGSIFEKTPPPPPELTIDEHISKCAADIKEAQASVHSREQIYEKANDAANTHNYGAAILYPVKTLVEMDQKFGQQLRELHDAKSDLDGATAHLAECRKKMVEWKALKTAKDAERPPTVLPVLLPVVRPVVPHGC